MPAQAQLAEMRKRKNHLINSLLIGSGTDHIPMALA